MRFVLCVDNYKEPRLEVWKVYEVDDWSEDDYWNTVISLIWEPFTYEAESFEFARKEDEFINHRLFIERENRLWEEKNQAKKNWSKLSNK